MSVTYSVQREEGVHDFVNKKKKPAHEGTGNQGLT
jgi:hypothetical protein